ncbi:erythromycin esterase family protein [Nocardia sp. CDC159]|uniref:Erythromycin esterase family protein n=1 Tax=Nocardia pulmonis TaxID=2951408 RepID=A0A9X2E5S2_9NOCA|nr:MULTISPECIES: erythromycin esterase family protein [Nocardia]MCM6772126.1 erythromycin esterase family protein [Nocardia pulmonis]MCM6785216.1 erythromycin esterase family protein [Nocardia sp. CDC159]
MTSPATARPHLFRDRREAGAVLAQHLSHYRDRADVVVLGLARGGVPVAWQVAAALNASLDVFVVRKLGAPDNPEFAVGALAPGDRIVIDDDIVRALRVAPEQLDRIIAREGRELARREAAYRGGRASLGVRGRTAILVDDGLATGASMRAAIAALRELAPARIVAAVPTAPESTCAELGQLVEEMVCATTPTPYRAVGDSYWDFTQVTDHEVGQLLDAPTTGHRPGPDPDLAALRRLTRPAPGGIPTPEAIDELVGEARIVLIGESTHGTHEFYAARAAITQYLVAEHDFRAVAAEADWPDAQRVDRFVRGRGRDARAEDALGDFERFPNWMWRNTVVRDFVGWLRAHNRAHPGDAAGFYGLDLYSMQRSVAEVIAYLDRVDPAAAARARRRYGCFDQFPDQGQSYGYAAAFGAGDSCERQVIEQLMELRDTDFRQVAADEPGLDADEAHFYAERNAATVRDAEEYYRAMFGGRTLSWNLRDTHMADTLRALDEHLTRRRGHPARIVVWAHNSHVGDSAATELADDGQITLGHLVRGLYHHRESRLIGMSTHGGTVIAADEWGGPARRFDVRPALPGSVDDLLTDVGNGPILLHCASTQPAAVAALDAPRLGRAIGVIYRPDTERHSHYYYVRPGQQFDAMIHIPQTTALRPLGPRAQRSDTTPETYPSGL